MARSIWVLLGLAACGGASPPPAPTPAPSATVAPAPADGGLAEALEEAVRGVEDPALAALLRDHWRWTLEEQPIWATRLGVHDFDDRLAIPTADNVAQTRARRRAFLARAEALEATLSGSDRVTYALFVAKLRSAIAQEVCRFEHWSVDPRHNVVTIFNRLPEDQRARTKADVDDLIARYRQIPAVVDAEIAQLGVGAGEGLFAPAETLRRVLTMVETQLAEPLDDWPMLAPLKAWPADATDAQRAALRAVIEDEVKPAFERYRILLGQLAPKGRPADRTGLAALPFGEACYAARLKGYSTLDLAAQAIHDIGEENIAVTDRELAELGQRALETMDLTATLERLRGDPKLYFESSEAVEQAARAALADAKAKMGDYFGTLPEADCVVTRIPAYEAPFTTIAYYRPPHADGSKPGEYFINVHAPTTRPRFEARVLAVHESIPGHHLQIAIAQELGSLPAFRKHDGFTAFVEGWALYTERLGETMGLYHDDLDRIGVASFDAWRAGRLVVDTGIHAFGWSRERAEAYLLEHTALTPKNVENEVDRYIAWPGQAVAYKLGQRQILALRRRAEERLGDRFSLPAFHDVVLGGGAVTLPVLEARVVTWIEAQSKTPP